MVKSRHCDFGDVSLGKGSRAEGGADEWAVYGAEWCWGWDALWDSLGAQSSLSWWVREESGGRGEIGCRFRWILEIRLRNVWG
jgi:hypothetical protein